MSNRPKPTALKIRQGNPGKRPLPKEEMKPTPGVPDCPEELNEFGKQEWRRLAPELERLGLMTTADLAAFYGYCHNWGRHREAEALVEKYGIIIQTPQGMKRNPACIQSNEALKECRMFLTEFGLSPASRGKVARHETEQGELEFNPWQMIEGGKS